MKNRKKILIVLLLILIGLLLTCMIQIYAKYLTSTAGNTSMAIAKWNILVNKLSIKNNTDISSSIVPVFPGNEHISQNIIAPTAEGYFDLNLDFTDADVSFQYKIQPSVDSKSSVKDLVATGYSIDNGPKIDFTNFNEPIIDTIPLNTEPKKRNIRIYIKWNDDTLTSQMPNTEDTLSTTATNPAIFHVALSFTQVLN